MDHPQHHPTSVCSNIAELHLWSTILYPEVSFLPPPLFSFYPFVNDRIRVHIKAEVYTITLQKFSKVWFWHSPSSVGFTVPNNWNLVLYEYELIVSLTAYAAGWRI
jgi:hypothetical protein